MCCDIYFLIIAWFMQPAMEVQEQEQEQEQAQLAAGGNGRQCVVRSTCVGCGSEGQEPQFRAGLALKHASEEALKPAQNQPKITQNRKLRHYGCD
jgi:hypothetical protein